MIIRFENNNIEKLFEYIGNNYGNCLYMYIDLKKYGLENDNFKIWVQYDCSEKICSLISEYHGGFQVFSKSNNFDAEEIANFIKEKNPTGISGMKKTIDKIHNYLPDFKQEIGSVAKLFELKYAPNINAYSVPFDELSEVAKVVSEDENVGKPYGYQSLFEQFCERKKDKFGRNFILRDLETNNIICHAATYAELPELAIISGVLTTPEYRGKGFSKETLAALCEELISEKKEVFSYFYILPAKKMHYGVGFEKIGDWSKLIE